MRKMNLMIVLLSLILLLTGCGTKADALQFVDIRFEGYNGNGQAVELLDEEALIESVIGSRPKSLDTMDEWLFEYDAIWMGLDVTCVPEDGLSNGDTVTVTITTSGDAAEKIQGGTKEFQVSGLPEVETVDIFKDISLEYKGIIGDTTQAVIHRNSDNEIVQNCQLSVDPVYDVKNGDTVTVTITNADALAEQYLCIPLELTKTFTVSGLDAYLTDEGLLPKDQVREIINQYIPVSGEKNLDFWTYGEPSYYKTYFCVGKDNKITADWNRLEIVACYDAYLNGEYRWTTYSVLTFRNVVVRADGAIELAYKDGIRIAGYHGADEMLETMEENYTVTEVDVGY